ncbi:MAG: DUF1254 domain-containing protein [Christensenellaceae bacterium]|nr:DUF1254 domain-containing protein [Christensenellaceae bacterium]
MKKWFSALLSALLICSLANGALAQSGETEAWTLLGDAYTYAFPLVIMDATKTAATNVEAPDLAGHAPINQLIHSQRLANAESKMVVTPNVDTIYTQAWLDISAEPMVYAMPEANRFFTVQVLDAWTNTPALLDQAGTYAFTLPDWEGTLPDSVTRVDVPTSMVWIIARIVLNGDGDLPAVREIQDGMKLLPLSAYESGAEYLPLKGEYRAQNDIGPVQAVLSMDMQTFFDTANRLIADNPPAQEDSEVVASFAKLNIGPGLQFDAEQLPGDRAAQWRELLTGLRAKLVAAGREYMLTLGSWKYFGAPIGDFGTAYAYRAMVALGGLGANTVDIAIYPKTGLDENGDALTGEKTYVLHFDSLPPTLEGGFWSITAYGSDDFLIANPLNRYCLNDRSDLMMNDDGSLDVTLSINEPQNTNNWLPVSKENFHLYMRVYLPDMAGLDHWQPPVITVQLPASA